MVRRLLVIFLAVVLVVPLGTATSQTVDEIGFDRRKAMQHVWRLAKRIGVRVRATKNERRGAIYIARQFEDIGYRVHIQKFDVDGGTSRNVVARWPGVIDHPFVVGAHMDTVPGSPGANDNASGVAVMIEVARIMAGSPAAKKFKFVAFGSEEYGENGRHHIGSLVYVNRLGKTGRERSPGMVSVDMIADGKPLIVGNSGMAGNIVARDLYRYLEDETDFAVRWETSCDCSDNGPFERRGIPASYMWSGDEPDYHAPSDTPENLVRKHLVRTGNALRAWLFSITHRDLRRFRRSH